MARADPCRSVGGGLRLQKFVTCFVLGQAW